VTGVDHAARAREILDAAVDSANGIERMLSQPLEGEPWQQLNEIDKRTGDAANKLASLDRLHAAAQVHATLALVEQQRIANDIAYAQLLEGQYVAAAERPGEFDWATREGSEARPGIVLARIRDGLELS
jgi:hypothetical protein